MKTIESLPQDIYDLLQNGADVSDEACEEFGRSLATLIKEKLVKEEREGVLRMSSIGAPDRKLWYQVNTPNDAEALDGKTYLKFLIGDIYEAVVLFLAATAGHKVEMQQVELDVNGVKGHPDAVIDGRVVDVKSASGFAISKFANHKIESDDPFHYLTQLNAYHSALKDNSAVTDKDHASFLACDKSDGTIVLDTYDMRKMDIPKLVEDKKKMVSGPIPPRCYDPVPDGASGNMKLSTQCSYCVFKKKCYPEVRTFLYSSGPRFLTKVVRLPDVTEV